VHSLIARTFIGLAIALAASAGHAQTATGASNAPAATLVLSEGFVLPQQ
jgi:hypothetical protein